MSNLTLPRISIIMPVLNRAGTIEKAIQSLLAQHYENLEFIVIDGGSTDGTLDIIRRYADSIAYWHSKPDGSPSIAVNLGIAKATGDLVALFMADDWYEPEVLQNVAQAFLANPDADIISCGGRIVSYDPAAQCYESQWTYDKDRQLRLNFYNVCFAVSAICCRFIRKSLYDRIGVYATSNAQGKHMFCNDKEFLLRAILHGAKEVFVPVMGHNYFASVASSTFGNHKENILSLCRDHLYIAENYLQRNDLSRRQRLLLHYWYTDQSTRLLLYAMLDKDFKSLSLTVLDGLRKYHIAWPLAVIANTVKITMRDVIRHSGSLLL